MELVFIRHGHGEHLEDYPNRLNTLHPGLTDYGVHQIIQLRKKLLISDYDIIIASPTERTIQTAEILIQNNNFLVSPCVGPRMFPLNPKNEQLQCDQIYNKQEIKEINSELEIIDLDLDIWRSGINRVEQGLFEAIACQFLNWCCSRSNRAIIISHDGTITNYRIYLGEKNLTRADFLGEAGVYITDFGCNSKKA